MTIQHYIAEQTERVAAALADFVGTTDPTRLTWQPSVSENGQTRSVLDQMAECISVNFRFAALLRGETAPEAPSAPQSAADAQAQIVASAGALAAAIRGLTDDDLEKPLALPRGSLPLSRAMLVPFRNMAYHAGQINFIQMLAGDTEFHAPPTWF